MSRFIPRGVAVAGIGKRFVAALIDAVVPALIGVGVSLLMQFSTSPTVMLVGSIASIVLLGAYALVQWWAYGSRGAGLGARVMGLRLVGMSDGNPIGWWRFFLRQLVYSVLMGTVIGGLALLVFLVIHERRQGWHDLAVRAVVVQPKEKPATEKKVSARKQAGSSTVGLPPHLSSGFAPGGHGSAPAAQESWGTFTPEHGSSAAPPAWMPRLETEPIIDMHSRPFDGHRGQPAGQQHPPSSSPQQQFPPPGQHHQPPAGPDHSPQQFGQPSHQQPPGHGQAAPGQAAPQQRPTTPPVNQGWIPLPTPTSVLEPSQLSPTPRVRQRDFGQVDDDDDGTRISKPLGDGSRPGDEGWYIRLDDSREVDLAVTVLLGRNPQKTQGDPEVHLVPAGGDGRMISRTHVLIGTDPRGVFVVDRGSTNGTALVTADGDLEPCPVGAQVRVRDGQQVSYGNRWFTVLRRPAS